MKSNIDLTETRDFPDAFNHSIADFVNRSLHGFDVTRIPWSLHFISCDSDLSTDTWYHMNDVFPVGYVKDIKREKFIYEACSEEFCDRCGKPVKLPWNRFKTLCYKCEQALRAEFGKRRAELPWE